MNYIHPAPTEQYNNGNYNLTSLKQVLASGFKASISSFASFNCSSIYTTSKSSWLPIYNDIFFTLRRSKHDVAFKSFRRQEV